MELRDTELQSWTPHGGELQALSWIWSPILRRKERSRLHGRDKNDRTDGVVVHSVALAWVPGRRSHLPLFRSDLVLLPSCPEKMEKEANQQQGEPGRHCND